MAARIASIFRHPVKGFTPEPLTRVDLSSGEGFPFDRLWAVENGPSGFDPDAPTFVPKQKFTVLASLPQVARARTRYDDDAGLLHAAAPGLPEITADLATEHGRAAFADWLTQLLGDDARGPLKVVAGPATHRFTDHPQGQVSIINLASLRDLERRLGASIDPLRFRANLYVDGWPAWAENDWVGERLALGGAAVEVFKPIVRCAATHVNPTSAERDMEITRALFEAYGNMHCGIYARVTVAGRIAVGDACSTPTASIAEEVPA